jgi:hypothetical protein
MVVGEVITLLPNVSLPQSLKTKFSVIVLGHKGAALAA